jgi:sugar lactone lactonase YvrE
MSKLALALLLSFAPTLLGQNGIITTTTVPGNGTSAMVPGMIAVDGADNLYIPNRAANGVGRIDAVTGALTIVAGNGTAGSGGDGGPAVQASLNGPSAVVVDIHGNVYIAEAPGNRVRRVDAATGIITTYAGTGAGGFSGDGGPAASGTLFTPLGLALDTSGNLYIADTNNCRVRRVDASTGILSTVAGTGVNAHAPDGTLAINASLALPAGVSFDPQGNLLISEVLGNDIRRVTNGVLSTFAGNGGNTFNGDGQAATSAALGMVSSNVIADPAGNLYFADGIGRVRRVDAVTGTIVTVAGNGSGAHTQSSASSGGGGGGFYNCPGNLGDGGPATLATLDGVVGLAMTSTGRLLMSDVIDCRVRSVTLPSPLQYTNTALTLSGTTLTVVVSPIAGSAVPTGTVQFMSAQPAGGPLPVTSAPLINGTATLDTGALPTGSGQLIAIYTGDASYNGSASVVIPVTGGGKATPQFASNVPYPVLVNTPVTLQVGVNGSRGVATGTISLYEGSTFLTTASLINGIGSFQYSSTVAGTHQITVQYPGDTNYAPATWTFFFAVTAPSTVVLTADSNPANTGATVTFTATVTPSTATGQVTFSDASGGLYGSSTILGGVATFSASFQTAGTHPISASYGGSTVLAPSTSAYLYETINAAPTSLALTGGGSPSTFGQSVTFTATITPAAAGGPIYFYDGYTQIGTAQVNNGTATFTATGLTAGTHSITAGYAGTSTYASSASPAVTQTVNKATPVVTVTSSANPVVSPGSVTFSASMTPTWSGATLQVMDGQTVLGSASASTGTISVTATLTPGVHTITAICPGDANLNQAASTVLNQTVQANTTVTVSAPASRTFYGQPVTYTASVSPAAASGTVQFLDNYAPAGSAPVVNGVATLTLPLPPAGIHSIQAVYSGDGVYLGSSSDVWVQIVNLASTQVSLAASPNPATATQPVVFTVTLSPATCTGSVQFQDGATVIGTATLSGATASLTTSALTVGSHFMGALYLGDANCSSAAAAGMNETITKAPTTTSLAANSGSIAYGQSVNLTASVLPAAATGTVQFLDGAAVVITLPVTNGTVPVVTETNLGAGTHSFTAVYSGDANYAASTSPVATVTVSKVNSTVALTSSANPSISGQTVLFTATITPANAAGNLQFMDGATVLGTVPATNGVASFTTSTLTIGSHSITVVYAGDSNCNPATSAVLSQTVNKLATTTTLSASAPTIVHGQTVTLTASIPFPGPTGTMQFLDGGVPLGTAALVSSSATLSVSTLGAGSHSITAVYSGDANDASSTSAPVTVSVSKANAAIALTASPNPSVAGQPVTFTAAVSPSSSTGTVQFLDGATVIGTAALNNGAASLSAALAVGTHSVTAVYSGDANYNGATSAAVGETVNKAASTTAISASSGTVSFGQSVSITAVVAPASATGVVQFLDSGAVIGTVTLSGGSATLIVGNFATGAHTITASYSGDGATLASASGAISVTVVKAATSLSVTSSLNPSLQNKPVTFTAQVSPAGATGSVKFYDGAIVIGTVALANGSASLTVSNLTAGSHTITAVYGGDVNYNGATSAALAQSVLIATTTALTSNKSSANQGQAVKLSAEVSPGGATGTVDFMDGATLLGTVQLSGGTATLAVSNLTVGTHSVTAVYSGASKYATSTSAPVTITIH